MTEVALKLIEQLGSVYVAHMLCFSIIIIRGGRSLRIVVWQACHYYKGMVCYLNECSYF